MTGRCGFALTFAFMGCGGDDGGGSSAGASCQVDGFDCTADEECVASGPGICGGESTGACWVNNGTSGVCIPACHNDMDCGEVEGKPAHCDIFPDDEVGYCLPD